MITHLGKGLDWWTPAFTTEAKGGRADDRARNHSYRVAVIPKQAGTATVWLVAFSS